MEAFPPAGPKARRTRHEARVAARALGPGQIRLEAGSFLFHGTAQRFDTPWIAHSEFYTDEEFGMNYFAQDPSLCTFFIAANVHNVPLEADRVGSHVLIACRLKRDVVLMDHENKKDKIFTSGPDGEIKWTLDDGGLQGAHGVVPADAGQPPCVIIMPEIYDHHEDARFTEVILHNSLVNELVEIVAVQSITCPHVPRDPKRMLNNACILLLQQQLIARCRTSARPCAEVGVWRHVSDAPHDIDPATATTRVGGEWGACTTVVGGQLNAPCECEWVADWEDFAGEDDEFGITYFEQMRTPLSVLKMGGLMTFPDGRSVQTGLYRPPHMGSESVPPVALHAGRFQVIIDANLLQRRVGDPTCPRDELSPYWACGCRGIYEEAGKVMRGFVVVIDTVSGATRVGHIGARHPIVQKLYALSAEAAEATEAAQRGVIVASMAHAAVVTEKESAEAALDAARAAMQKAKAGGGESVLWSQSISAELTELKIPYISVTVVDVVYGAVKYPPRSRLYRQSAIKGAVDAYRHHLGLLDRPFKIEYKSAHTDDWCYLDDRVGKDDIVRIVKTNAVASIRVTVTEPPVLVEAKKAVEEATKAAHVAQDAAWAASDRVDEARAAAWAARGISRRRRRLLWTVDAATGGVSVTVTSADMLTGYGTWAMDVAGAAGVFAAPWRDGAVQQRLVEMAAPRLGLRL